MRFKDYIIYIIISLMITAILIYNIQRQQLVYIETATPIIEKEIIISDSGIWQCKTDPNLSDKEKQEMYEIAAEVISRYKEDHYYNEGCTDDITPDLIISLIDVESDGNQFCKGSSGEIGLTQVIPRYHEEGLKKAGIINSTDDLWNKEKNIEAGIYVLMHYAKRTNTIKEALSKYNTGKVCNRGIRYANKIISNMKGETN